MPRNQWEENDDPYWDKEVSQDWLGNSVTRRMQIWATGAMGVFFVLIAVYQFTCAPKAPPIVLPAIYSYWGTCDDGKFVYNMNGGFGCAEKGTFGYEFAVCLPDSICYLIGKGDKYLRLKLPYTRLPAATSSPEIRHGFRFLSSDKEDIEEYILRLKAMTVYSILRSKNF
jgi:hypothetical protein